MPRLSNRGLNPHTHLPSDIVGGVGNAASFSALDFVPPNSPDWSVNSPGQVQARVANAGVSVWSLDDTVEEGFGTVPILIPAGTVTLQIGFFLAAHAAPGVASTAGLELHARSLGGAVGAWNSVVLVDAVIPASTGIVSHQVSVALAALGLADDQLAQLEVTRQAPTGGVNLVGDLDVIQMVVSF